MVQAEKANYASLKIKDTDYDIDFDDSQRLGLLWQNLSIACTILDSTMDVAEAIRDQCNKVMGFKRSSQEDYDEALEQIQLDICRIKSYQRTSKALLVNIEECSLMVYPNRALLESNV